MNYRCFFVRKFEEPLGVSTCQLEQVVERTVRELEMRKGESGGAGCVGSMRSPYSTFFSINKRTSNMATVFKQ